MYLNILIEFFFLNDLEWREDEKSRPGARGETVR